MAIAVVVAWQAVMRGHGCSTGLPEAAIRRGLGVVIVAVGTVFLGLGLS